MTQVGVVDESCLVAVIAAAPVSQGQATILQQQAIGSSGSSAVVAANAAAAVVGGTGMPVSNAGGQVTHHAGMKRQRLPRPNLKAFASSLIKYPPGMSSWASNPTHLWTHLAKSLPDGLVFTNQDIYDAVHEQMNCQLDIDRDASMLEHYVGTALGMMSPATGESALYPHVDNFLTHIWGALQTEASANVFSAAFDRTNSTGLTTVSKKRPDVCVYAMTKPVLLLKGELKDSAGELSKAVEELVEKMTGWNPHLLAGLPFLPCFVWAGSAFQWAMLRGKATAPTAEVILSPESINLSGQASCARLLQESMKMLTVLSYLGNAASPYVRLPLFRWVHWNGNSFRMHVNHVEKVCKPAFNKGIRLAQKRCHGGGSYQGNRCQER
jgi:hypothetical protein